jgi:outer membrane receptor protein involved in Fe transport
MQNRSLWLLLLMVALLFTTPLLVAQSTTATVSGTVADESGAVVPDVKIVLLNVATSAKREVTTNNEGYFSIALLPPGRYSLRATREQFAHVEIPNINLNTNDERAFRIKLKVGSVNESVSVDASTVSVETSTAVSTVVDNNFVNQLPLKGRSFQSLLLMTPGVINATGQEAGQISVNGLRTDANYWTVDGVAANVGVGIASAGNNVNQTFTGSVPGFNAFGGTNGLISVEALQEFKVQTSTYSAEFGRQPGGQVQLTTRSGSNQFHGVLYDYFRNDILEANDWFSNRRGDPKPKTRLNDFGGTFSGPIFKNRTFFFFSYEGMRYRHPSGMTDTYVPSDRLRNDSRINPTIRALLNAFPVSSAPENMMPDPNNPDNLIPDGTSNYTFWQSSPMNMDSYSIRLDQIINSKWTAFGRYSYAPSNQQIWSLSQLQSTAINMRTITLGLTGVLSPRITNQITLNYSSSGGDGDTVIEPVNGAVVPSTADLFGGTVPAGNTRFASWYFLGWPGNSFGLAAGDQTQNKNRSFNLTDNFSWSKGTHSLKVGVDFRYLAPRLAPMDYSLNVSAYSQESLYNNTMDYVSVYAYNQATIISKNLSLFAQDSWKVSPRLSLDLGVRWELNPPPHGLSSTDLIFVKGWQNPATMTIAPEGTQGYTTDYRAFAPRFGGSYELLRRTGWETILRGGFGMFYDLGSATAGYGANGFRSGNPSFGVPFPFSDSVIAPPAPRTYPTPPYDQYASGQALVGMLDGWKTPATYQWNFGIQQSLGNTQVLTLNYVGNAARGLPRSYAMTSGTNGYGNPNFPDWASILITRNDPGYGDTSDYNALQVQFQRRMTRGLQILSNYTWAHAIDTASQDTNIFDYVFPSLKPAMTRGSSDNDRRHVLNIATTYQVPRLSPTNGVLGFLNKVFAKGWSLDGIFTAQSGAPLNVTFMRDTAPFDPNGVSLRADLVPGAPIWISDSSAPGGKRLNMAAFALPVNGMGPAELLTQGNLARNSITAPGSWQVDTSIGRDFRLSERFKLQYRAELFNALNHANFGGYDTGLGFYSPQWGNYPENPSRFGRATTMLGTGGQGGSLGMIPLFSNGGPRSVQMALKLVF